MTVSGHNKLKMLKIVSLVCVSSETHNLQRVFRCIFYTKGEVIVPGVRPIPIVLGNF